MAGPMGRVIQLGNSGRDRRLAEEGLVELKMIVSTEVARRVALDAERVQNSLTECSSTVVMLMDMLGIDAVTFDPETIRAAVPRAFKLQRKYEKDGRMTCSFIPAVQPATNSPPEATEH